MPTTDEIRQQIDELMQEKRLLPNRFREAARSAKAAGMTVTEIAFRFEVTSATIYAWLKEDSNSSNQ